MINKNDKLKLNITDMGINGEGIAKHDGAVIFVPFALTGEVVMATVIFAKSNFYVAKITEIILPSPHRTQPACPHFKICGGCNLQHLNYNQALEHKQKMVARTFLSVAKQEVNVLNTHPSSPYEYRNKFSFPIGFDGCGFIGMYKANSHNIVKVDTCKIQEPWLSPILNLFNNFLKLNTNSVYNEQTKKGLIKHLVCRYYNNQLLVCVVTNGNKLNNAEYLIKELSNHFENFGLMLNVNTLNNNVILTNKYVYLHGIKTIEANTSGILHSISLNSFMQVNTQVASQIYDETVKMIDGNVVVNAFSGSGFLSAMLCKSAKHVYGIEIVESSHHDAEQLKTKNNLNNLTNILGDVSEQLKTISQFDSIVLDPPRKGCSKNVVDTILKVLPKTIVYISCSPSTLARDVQLLSEKYNLTYLKPFDMFPQTKHVECLAKLELK